MADAVGTVATFTVDRLAWSPSPPVIFAVVDFDGGGRVPIELTDCTPEDVAVGSRVVLNWAGAKRLAISLGQVVRQYEERAGEINLGPRQGSG